MVLEDPGCVGSIIQDWQSMLPATLNKWKIEQKDLQIFFEDFRNNLLQNKEVTKPQKHCWSAVAALLFAILFPVSQFFKTTGWMGEKACDVSWLRRNPQSL